ncbi:MAG: hypothetical protein JNM61_06470 [Zoogloeaceae bacterium]|nr:hypothetical protein [Zoogloeaceae bacterium]
MKTDQFTVEMAQEFHRRMAAIVEAVQVGIWASGRHDLLSYDSDFGFGQQRGQQTLVLKTASRSAYVRLDWDTILGNTANERQRVDDAIHLAVGVLG